LNCITTLKCIDTLAVKWYYYSYIMIKVFIYENPNTINSIFQEDDYNIPFLGGTLMDFVCSSYERFSLSLGKDINFYVPLNWNVGLETYDNIPSKLSDEHECVFILDLFTMPLTDFTIEDYHFLIQNKDVLYAHPSGVKMGCINKNTNISRINSEDISGFSNIVTLNSSNFLSLNRHLLPALSVDTDAFYPEFYGNPIVLCDPKNIYGSKICGPCIIGEDVKIINSVIYPGSIIVGNSVIKNSTIFESFLCESSLSNSELKNSLVALSSIEDVDLSNSILPRGSVLYNAGKR
jgi:hypothetical protein